MEFRVLGRASRTRSPTKTTRAAAALGAFYAGALTIGEDGEVYHDKGYLVIPEGHVGIRAVVRMARARGHVAGGRQHGGQHGGRSTIGSTERQCVEIADSSNNVPTGRTCPSGGMSGHAVDRLTARFQEVPRSHDGESEFTLRVAFIEDVGISPTSLREDAPHGDRWHGHPGAAGGRPQRPVRNHGGACLGR